jgi:hypothetical protein
LVDVAPLAPRSPEPPLAVPALSANMVPPSLTPPHAAVAKTDPVTTAIANPSLCIEQLPNERGCGRGLQCPYQRIALKKEGWRGPRCNSQFTAV